MRAAQRQPAEQSCGLPVGRTAASPWIYDDLLTFEGGKGESMALNRLYLNQGLGVSSSR